MVGGHEDNFEGLGVGVAAIELGELGSKAFTGRAPVGAEVEQECAFAIEGARGASIVHKANFGDESGNSHLCRHSCAVDLIAS